MSSTQDKRRYEVLDGLRGVAALLVLGGHASAMALGAERTLVPGKVLAVAFFFVLSGFVIASAYEDRVRQGMSVYDFMRRRAIRLYPMIIVSILLATLDLGISSSAFRASPKAVTAVLCGAAALPSPNVAFGFSHFPINPPEWSLSNEIVAYAAFALFLGRLGTKSLIAACFLMCGFFAVDHFALHDQLMLIVTLVYTTVLFCIGVLLWRARSWIGRLDFKAPSWLLAAALVLLCILPARLGPGVMAIGLLVIVPSVVVLGAVRGLGGAHSLERQLGRLSFPLYAVHWPVLMIVQQLLQPRFGPFATMAIGSLAAIGSAWGILVCFDEPIRAWLTAKTRRHGQTGARVNVSS